MSDLFVYFDGVSATGQSNGAIQIELVANILDPAIDDALSVRRVTTAHLRCSPAAAAELIQGLQKALEMEDNPNPPAVSSGPFK